MSSAFLCPRCVKPTVIDLIDPHHQKCGHAAEFVDQPKQRFVCALTHDVFSRRHVICTPCEHVFEKPALTAALSRRAECPLCSAPVAIDDCKESRMLKEMIGELEVKCMYDKCPWTGPLDRFAHHVKNECEAALVPCRETDCQFKGTRDDVKKHNCAALVHRKADERVVLNIGGTRFHTTVTTLTKVKDSLLWSMFSGSFDKKEEYFIDRNGQYFGLILDWLRDYPNQGPVLLDESAAARSALEREIKFYMLPISIPLQIKRPRVVVFSLRQIRVNFPPHKQDGNYKVSIKPDISFTIRHSDIPGWPRSLCEGMADHGYIPVPIDRNSNGEVAIFQLVD